MNIAKVIILSGGRATRLSESARDIPKSLVEIKGQPILEWQLRRLNAAGLTDVRLALGFRADQIIAFLNQRGHRCDYVIEPQPLGTGGATRLASQGIRGPFMVLNGDTLSDFDFPAILRAHVPGKALMVSFWKDDARDFGLMRLEGDGVREFLEKPSEPLGGHINAGCYILHPEHFQVLPDGPFMLETEIFPRLARENLLKTYVHKGFFEDLGTEERLARIRESFPLEL